MECQEWRILFICLILTRYGTNLASYCTQAIESVTVTLGTVKDNSIYAESDNSNGQGIDLFAGRTQGQMGSGIRRALIKFDLTDSIPTNTVVESISLTLFANKRGAPTTDSPVDTFLHRLNQDWGEGNSQGAGRGDVPTPGDATWNFKFFDTESWEAPGGGFRYHSIGNPNFIRDELYYLEFTRDDCGCPKLVG